MNTERDNIQQQKLDSGDTLIKTDAHATDVLLQALPRDAIGRALLEIARKVSESYSFVDHQTYPRPSHPLLEKRLAPEFTLFSVITSLRCTLEIEQKVTGKLVDITNGSVESLNSLSAQEIETILKPAGMATKKAIWIANSLNRLRVERDYNIDALRSQPVDIVRKKIMKLEGFGPKAADCFILLGLDMPTFPIDTNIFKLVTRLYPEKIMGSTSAIPSFSSQVQVASVKELIQGSISPDVRLYQVLHTFLLLAERYRMAMR